MNKLTKIFLCILLIISVTACGNKQNGDVENDEDKEEVKEIVYDVIETKELDSFITQDNIYDSMDEANKRYGLFANKFLLSVIDENDNEIVSPLSVYYAMGLLANGAEGNTKAELETLLGMTVDDVNLYLKHVNDRYTKGIEAMFKTANSIWLNNGLGINLKKDYINKIDEFYGSCVYEDSFDDANKIVDEVNKWASDNTEGGIDNILDASSVNKNTPMLVLNALMSGDKWCLEFDENETYKQTFYNRDETYGNVDMMHDTLSGYWHDDNSEGFVKELKNGINVVGILPNEGIDIYDFINTMSPTIFNDYIHGVIHNENYRETTGVYWCIVDEHITNLSFPKFSYDKEYDLKTTFKKLGLKNIFDYTQCDFSGLAEGDEKVINELFVDNIKQKDTIKVDEKEVVAAAVTIVELGLGSVGCKVDKYIYHDVTFDRPFIYALVSGNIPIFIGVVTNLGDPIDTPISGSPEGAIMKLTNISGLINIRYSPSTKVEIVGGFEKGQIVYAYESQEKEGYTWYRIGANKWVANKNNEWIKVEPLN